MSNKLHGTRPECQQPREPCIWVSHLVYFWNHSRGWCSSPRCQEKFADRGMVFMGKQGLNVGGDNSTSWSLDRTHNDGLHQWWNIAGCVHSGCQNFTNSHPTNGYSAKRLAVDPNDPPFPQFDVDDVGGPTVHIGRTSTATLPRRLFQLMPCRVVLANDARKPCSLA